MTREAIANPFREAGRGSLPWKYCSRKPGDTAFGLRGDLLEGGHVTFLAKHGVFRSVLPSSGFHRPRRIGGLAPQPFDSRAFWRLPERVLE